jgi:TolB protein
MIPVKSLTPLPTPTTTPTSVNTILLAKQPIPPDFYNKILFQSGPREAPQIWVIDPDGKNLGLVPDRSVYARVAARDAIDPNFAFLLYNAPDRDNPDTLQIWIQTLYMAGTPPQRLTAIKKGVAYAPAWAPFGNKFAYVSQESGRDEIWIFDLETKKPQQLTFNSNQDYFWNQFPSWSPDGKRIAFSSDRGHIGSFTEIWTMSSDGTGEVRLGDGTRDAWAPIWVKWKR